MKWIYAYVYYLLWTSNTYSSFFLHFSIVNFVQIYLHTGIRLLCKKQEYKMTMKYKKLIWLSIQFNLLTNSQSSSKSSIDYILLSLHYFHFTFPMAFDSDWSMIINCLCISKRYIWLYCLHAVLSTIQRNVSYIFSIKHHFHVIWQILRSSEFSFTMFANAQNWMNQWNWWQ